VQLELIAQWIQQAFLRCQFKRLSLVLSGRDTFGPVKVDGVFPVADQESG
jgi:hypothetical protein